MPNVTDADTSEIPAASAPAALASAPAAGTIENRVAQRRNVTWKARVMMPQGGMVDLKTTDISSSGLGLVSADPLPMNSVVQIALQVPHLTTAGTFTVITGRVKIAFQVMRGNAYRVGAQWIDLSDAYRQLLVAWVEKLPGKPVED